MTWKLWEYHLGVSRIIGKSRYASMMKGTHQIPVGDNSSHSRAACVGSILQSVYKA